MTLDSTKEEETLVELDDRRLRARVMHDRKQKQDAKKTMMTDFRINPNNIDLSN